MKDFRILFFSKKIFFVCILIFFVPGFGNASFFENLTSKNHLTISLQNPKKFVLKSSNQKYITLKSENQILTADEKNIAKAERFEIIESDENKNYLKASTGKYVCADQFRNEQLNATRNSASVWETYELLPSGLVKIYIQTSSGKFVTIDKKGILNATVFSKSEAELFTIEEIKQ